MAKKSDFQPNQSDVDRILSLPKKVTFSGVAWKGSADGRMPCWFKLDLQPFDIDDKPLTNVRIMLHWRQPIVADIDVAKISYVVFYHNRRIFALDPYPDERKPHRNRNPVNHPDYIEVARGPHYHQYFESVGEDVALTLSTDLEPDDFLGYWNYFCSRLNINYTGSVPLPNQDESGQLSWEM
ncbi:TPA: hypothetical protein ACPZPV_002238 [Yersinia enterocolitica]|uniref:hypothetical protein n=1 Tax=Yersinia TaxID=629 RepID=UPI0004F6675B|nr:hypothetical protein [Yersinia rochesterensis]AIN17090.1 hypothetical protein DJ57_2580 [Yersinia rochesterensis]EKN3779507.1 hypothetical protein [Yersinia enterocolitica]ELI8371613.1 hypothetical protein [Yersinia enterocolitica]HDL7955711.1 hypothetical protein [Yersinia enterocolitica]